MLRCVVGGEAGASTRLVLALQKIAVTCRYVQTASVPTLRRTTRVDRSVWVRETVHIYGGTNACLQESHPRSRMSVERNPAQGLE